MGIRTLVVAVVCLCVLAGGAFGLAALDDEVPAGDRLPSWSEVYPSMTLDEEETESLVHERVNEAREERGAAALPRDDDLQQVARNHSEDMAERGYFDHTTPGGLDPAARVERAGIECGDVGENIVKLPRSNHEKPLAEDVVEAWLNSPGHFINLVDGDWSRMAIGVVADADSVYVTQKFCS